MARGRSSAPSPPSPRERPLPFPPTRRSTPRPIPLTLHFPDGSIHEVHVPAGSSAADQGGARAGAGAGTRIDNARDAHGHAHSQGHASAHYATAPAQDRSNARTEALADARTRLHSTLQSMSNEHTHPQGCRGHASADCAAASAQDHPTAHAEALALARARLHSVQQPMGSSTGIPAGLNSGPREEAQPQPQAGPSAPAPTRPNIYGAAGFGFHHEPLHRVATPPEGILRGGSAARARRDTAGDRPPAADSGDEGYRSAATASTPARERHHRIRGSPPQTYPAIRRPRSSRSRSPPRRRHHDAASERPREQPEQSTSVGQREAEREQASEQVDVVMSDCPLCSMAQCHLVTCPLLQLDVAQFVPLPESSSSSSHRRSSRESPSGRGRHTTSSGDGSRREDSSNYPSPSPIATDETDDWTGRASHGSRGAPTLPTGSYPGSTHPTLERQRNPLPRPPRHYNPAYAPPVPLPPPPPQPQARPLPAGTPAFPQPRTEDARGHRPVIPPGWFDDGDTLPSPPPSPPRRARRRSAEPDRYPAVPANAGYYVPQHPYYAQHLPQGYPQAAPRVDPQWPFQFIYDPRRPAFQPQPAAPPAPPPLPPPSTQWRTSYLPPGVLPYYPYAPAAPAYVPAAGQGTYPAALPDTHIGAAAALRMGATLPYPVAQPVGYVPPPRHPPDHSLPLLTPIVSSGRRNDILLSDAMAYVPARSLSQQYTPAAGSSMVLVPAASLPLSPFRGPQPHYALIPNPERPDVPVLRWDVRTLPALAQRVTPNSDIVPFRGMLNDALTDPEVREVQVAYTVAGGLVNYFGPIHIRQNRTVTVGDALNAIYNFFQAPLREDQAAVIRRASAVVWQTCVDAFRRRCREAPIPDATWREGMKRVDCLGEKVKYWGAWVTHNVPERTWQINLGLAAPSELAPYCR